MTTPRPAHVTRPYRRSTALISCGLSARLSRNHFFFPSDIIIFSARTFSAGYSFQRPLLFFHRIRLYRLCPSRAYKRTGLINDSTLYNAVFYSSRTHCYLKMSVVAPLTVRTHDFYVFSAVVLSTYRRIFGFGHEFVYLQSNTFTIFLILLVLRCEFFIS